MGRLLLPLFRAQCVILTALRLLQDEHWAVQHEVMQSYVAYARSSASEDIREVIPKGLLPGVLLLLMSCRRLARSSEQDAHVTEHTLSCLWQLLLLSFAYKLSIIHPSMAVVRSSLQDKFSCCTIDKD